MSELVESLAEPLGYGFARAGFAAAVLVGVATALMSCLLVIRRQALLGDAISHAVLLGVALGYLTAGDAGVLWGALAVAVASALAIAGISQHTPVRSDAAMGVVFTFTFALGLAIISAVRPRGVDLFHVLFGNLLGIDPSDLALTGTAAGVVVVAIVVGFRTFQTWCFDADAAAAAGMRTALVHYAFTVVLAAAIVAALQAVGVILVIALLVTPGATAQLLTSRLHTMMLVAVGCGLIASVGGLYTSLLADVAAGPSIVLVASLLFAVAVALAPRHGLLAQLRARARPVAPAAAGDR